MLLGGVEVNFQTLLSALDWANGEPHALADLPPRNILWNLLEMKRKYMQEDRRPPSAGDSVNISNFCHVCLVHA